jgi:16S rRNA (guanine966-N2)-methyltransferase
MRIISGKFKGKKLIIPNRDITRPLKDLVKESIFNLIIHSNKINIDIENSNILDLFSGSGSFGLECISRGARNVIFFENNSETLKILDKNIQSLKSINNYKIINKDCFDYSNFQNQMIKKFDIIFVDPPYKELRINMLIDKIIEMKLLKQNGIMIIHRNKKDSVKLTEKLTLFESRVYGISKIIFGN